MHTSNANLPLQPRDATLAVPGASAHSDREMLTVLAREAPADSPFTAVPPSQIHGQLPADLAGTLFRNGPGGRTLFGSRVGHAFEGDGVVTALRLGAGHAQRAVATTQSAGLVRERAAGQRLYGSDAPWWRRMKSALTGQGKNTANTSVMMWRDRLYALMEGGWPTELDPTTLATVGETDFGVIKGAFSAHPHTVAADGAIYNIGLEYGRQNRVHLYRLPQAGQADRVATVPLDFSTMIHDFMVTEHHAILFVAPIVLSLPRMFLQWGAFADMWQWQPSRGTEVIVIPLANPAAVTRWHEPAFHVWHFANAWSESADRIIMDYVRYPDFSTFQLLAGNGQGAANVLEGALHRATLEPRRQALHSEPLAVPLCDFPVIDPAVSGARHRTIYAAAADGASVLAVDSETGVVQQYKVGAGEFATEPVFVPRRHGNYLITLVHRTDGAAWHIVDGASLASGPVAIIDCGTPMHFTYHGTWFADRRLS